MQTVPSSAEGSQKSSGQFIGSLGEEVELVQLSSNASHNNLQSTTEIAPADILDKSELPPLKLRSLGVRAEGLSIASLSPLQSDYHFLDRIEELPLTLQQKEAISRRHHLKFITGHYGSGKVTVSYH